MAAMTGCVKKTSFQMVLEKKQVVEESLMPSEEKDHSSLHQQDN